MELLEYERKHLEMLRGHLSECAVLLKKDGTFPLKEPGKIALFGNGIRKTIKGGTGSGEVNSRFFVNVEDGFKELGFTITSGDWLDAYDKIYDDARKTFGRERRKGIKGEGIMALMASMGMIMEEPEYDLPLVVPGDTCIYVLSRISGEGSDRQYRKGDFILTDTEIRDIMMLNGMFERFMLVINAGGPVDLTPVMDVRNILVLSQLGVETGSALARIVLGDSPSGKLTTTWASAEGYPNKGEFGDRDDTRYKEGIYVGYRRFDTMDIKPTFPFGFGLSYTEFRLGDPTVSLDGTRVKVRLEVENTGGYDGRETVQIYVTKPAARLDQPFRELAGFKKTGLLKAGGKETVEVVFDMRDIASYDEERALFILEEGRYIIWAGNSSESLFVAGCVELDGEAITRKVRNAFGKPDFEDIRPAKKEIFYDGDTLKLSASLFDKDEIMYDREREIDPLAEELTDEQLMRLGMGAFDEKGGLTSIVGNAGFAVAGAAGETYEIAQKGIKRMVMADGPAGVRIAKDVARDGDKVISLASPIPETMLEFIPDAVKAGIKLLSKKPSKNAEIFHQYATAIPIGTAIAQSWNPEFAEICGDIVGDEMERFGIHLWLAPALNIHRDVRCGRNFEYYSEDPLVSGTFAAAITRGVQKHKGCGTTIKHVFANNQETNRTGSNSLISERAIREIYLKGFEICIRESQPRALMTSYNLVNGEHTNHSRDLNTYVLRDEFGYEGVIMTDWCINHGEFDKNAAHKGSYADRVARCGNEIYMPGSKSDFNDMKKGFKAGMLTRKQLMINATNILRVMRRLTD